MNIKIEDSEIPGIEVIKKNNRVAFDASVRRMCVINEHLASLKVEKEVLQVDIEAALVMAGVSKVGFSDGVTASYFKSSNSSIKSDKLLLAGVTPDVIQACTVRKQFTVVQVKMPKAS